MDQIDKNPRYLEDQPESMLRWNRFTHPFLKQVVFNLTLPEGMVVELGTYRCARFDLLCQHYGADRCLGFDIINYSSHPRVIECDIRSIPEPYQVARAFVWNEARDWTSSPESKMAALEYAKRNLVPGGYYMETGLKHIPEAGLPPFRLIVTTADISLWKNQGYHNQPGGCDTK